MVMILYVEYYIVQWLCSRCVTPVDVTATNTLCREGWGNGAGDSSEASEPCCGICECVPSMANPCALLHRLRCTRLNTYRDGRQYHPYFKITS